MLQATDTPADAATSFRRAQWRILLVSMFCYAFYYTGRQTFGWAIPGIEKDLGLSKTTLGWVSTAMLWSYALGQAINGNLGDKYGGRSLVSLGAIGSVVMNWVTSFGNGLAWLMGAWGFNGYVQALGWAPGSRVISNWWGHHERGKAFGLYLFAAGTSSVLTYALAAAILSLDLNWRWIFRLPVLLLLVGGLVYFLLVRNKPQDLGFAPLPNDEASPEQAAGAAPEEERPLTSRERYTLALTNWRFMLASVAIGFQSLARYGLLIWVPVHLLGSDWKSDPSTKWLSLALPVGMALGAVTSGWLSDRLFNANRSRPIILFMALAAASTLWVYFIPHGHPISILALFLCGFFVYGPQAPFWALCPDLLGKRCAGTGVGVMNTLAYLFAGLGEPLIGWIIQSNGNNTVLVFPVVAVSCAACVTVAAFIRR